MSYFEPKTCNTCNRKFVTEKHFFQNTSRWRICSQHNLWFNCSCDSTLLIPKGKFNWYNPGKHLSKECKSVFNEIASDLKIPYIKNNIIMIQQMISNNEAIEKIYREIKKDALISSQIIVFMEKIQIANNTGTRKGPDLLYAVNYLGPDRISELLIPAFLATIKIECQKFNIDTFWSRSTQTAMLAVLLNSFSKQNLNKDLVFIAAALCNIGILVNAIYYPEATDLLWKAMTSPKTQNTWENLETESKMHSSSIMGEIAGSLWGLSEPVLEVISCHRKIDISQNVKSKNLIYLISLSEMCASWIMGEPHLINNKLLEDRLKYFNLTEDEFDSFANLNLRLVK